MIYEDRDADRFMDVPTEAVLDKLQSSPEGRMHLQLAMQAVMIEGLRAEVAALSNGQVTVGADDYDIHDD